MRFRHLPIVLVLLLSLSACDTSLQKATQQLLTKENPTTPVPSQPTENQGADQASCPETNPHPLGESIAEKFSVTYDEVIDWYCDGYIFEDILLALQTSQMAEIEPDTLLKELETKSWESIWNELGIVDTGD